MIQLDFLEGHFQKGSILRLAEIFNTANETKSESKIQKLRLDLIDILNQEKSIGLRKWEISPSGNHHIVVTESLCLLINIWGVNVLFENWLFFDGELSVTNFQWYEEDHLIVFDVYYIVHNEWQKCICHYADGGFFTYFTSVNKVGMLKDNMCI